MGFFLMEPASSVAATRGGSLQNPPPTPSRKEWRAVSDSHNVGNATDYLVMYLLLNLEFCSSDTVLSFE